MKIAPTVNRLIERRPGKILVRPPVESGCEVIPVDARSTADEEHVAVDRAIPNPGWMRRADLWVVVIAADEAMRRTELRQRDEARAEVAEQDRARRSAGNVGVAIHLAVGVADESYPGVLGHFWRAISLNVFRRR